MVDPAAQHAGVGAAGEHGQVFQWATTAVGRKAREGIWEKVPADSKRKPGKKQKIRMLIGWEPTTRYNKGYILDYSSAAINKVYKQLHNTEIK